MPATTTVPATRSKRRSKESAQSSRTNRATAAQAAEPDGGNEQGPLARVEWDGTRDWRDGSPDSGVNRSRRIESSATGQSKKSSARPLDRPGVIAVRLEICRS